MNARQTVHLWRSRLLVAIALSSLGVGVGVLGATRILARWLGGSDRSAVVLAVTAAVGAVVIELWRRTGGALTAVRVALWLEERVPGLDFALVSAVDAAPAPWCEARVAAHDVSGESWRSLRRSLLRPAACALAGTALMIAAPMVARAPADVGARVREALHPGDPLAVLHARVAPPPYSRLAVEEVVQPDVLRPLAGSEVTLSGPLPVTTSLPDLGVLVDSVRRAAVSRDSRWEITLRADTSTHVLRFTHGAASRLVVLEPRRDSLPAVEIQLPARDTVLREARGVFALRARATDDLGLVSARFEYIISSGEGERFTFRSGALGAVAPGGRRTVDLTATLDVARLALGPGDVLHLRAVASDANSVSGPGSGASDTRTFRVARAGEYDSVAVDPAAPPEADKSILSQRMLINLTEALVKRLRSIDRPTLVSESRRIARDQARLRKQVSDLVFARLGDEPSGEHFHGDGHDHNESEPLRRNLTPEELLAAAEKATGTGAEATDFDKDETPVVAINKPLLEAYNAMWDAGRELDLAQPRAALPPMYAALAAIQKARAAERLYLRGTPPRVVVDVNRARLAGKDRGLSATRAAAVPGDPVRRRAMERLERVLGVRPPSAAADSLLLLRLSIVGLVPEAARALEGLIADVRAGREAAANVRDVRRALDSRATRRDSLLTWSAPR